MKFKKILFILLMLFTLLLLPSCKEEDKGEKLVGKYELETVYVDGEVSTTYYITYTIEFKEDYTCEVRIYGSFGLETRNSTYYYDGNFITETYKDQTYSYMFSDNKLIHEDTENGIKVIFKVFEEEIDEKDKAVDFDSVLFGESIDETKIFNYCPAILVEDGVMHIWYCTNKTSGVIMDHIGYRTGTQTEDGKWKFSEQQIVLAPTPGTWDGRHTCDPAVIKGEFKMQGETYNYLMSYLGCVTEDYSKNETGIAVSKSPAGPWIKVDSLNPIVPWGDPKIFGDGTDRNGYTSWGTGMPALISVDGKGEVLLFFQTASRGTGIQRWDLSDLDNPQVKFDVARNNNGILNSQGVKCGVGITDYAYDPVAKRFYVFGVTNEKNPPNITETLVNSHCVLAYIDNVESTEHLCELLETNNYSWINVGYVGPAQTGWDRNHNPGIVRDPYGYIMDSTTIQVVVATGRRDYPNQNIYTYRLHGYTFKLNLE